MISYCYYAMVPKLPE